MIRRIDSFLMATIRNGFMAQFRSAGVGGFPVYLAISAFGDEKEVARVTYAKLCEITGYSLDHVYRTIEGLERLGFLERKETKVRNKPTEYRLKI